MKHQDAKNEQEVFKDILMLSTRKTPSIIDSHDPIVYQ